MKNTKRDFYICMSPVLSLRSHDPCGLHSKKKKKNKRRHLVPQLRFSQIVSCLLNTYASGAHNLHRFMMEFYPPCVVSYEHSSHCSVMHMLFCKAYVTQQYLASLLSRPHRTFRKILSVEIFKSSLDVDDAYKVSTSYLG